MKPERSDVKADVKPDVGARRPGKRTDRDEPPPPPSRDAAFPPVRTLGPVSDLERHLPNEWWRTLFNSLYLKTDGDVVENDLNTIAEVDLLVGSAELQPADKILDLCCGQGRHSIELARRGFKDVTGLDRSRYLVRLARKRARRLGLNVNFHEGDARKFRPPSDTFACVAIMGNSFGYFDREEDDLAVLRAASRLLRSKGVIALDLVDGEWMKTHFEPRSWEWIDQAHFVCRERKLAGDGMRLISREVVTHAERGVIADQFYAERLYTRDQIAEQLDKAGFGDVHFHATLVADSDRGQDLGMMAHRMFLTARAPRKEPKRDPAVRHITVLLGDPSLPDDVKRGGSWNPEDFQTIHQLKSALAGLTQYRFSYLDNHASLAAELRKNPPRLVLNFCDEGLNNDAFKELHVPALLEMLDIPYSGAGPTCLGLCYNKSFVRSIAAGMEIPVPLETFFNPADQAATLPSVFPALVKPNYGDSSIGITKDAVVRNSEELISYLEKLRDELPGRPVLIQEFLSGPEYSVSLIGNPGIGFHALPILEVDYSALDRSLPRILGYESKWHPDSPYWTDIKYHVARLDEDRRRRLIDHSCLLFERLDCRDYARFDFRTDEQGEIKLLEANPNPGWCWDGKLNIMAGFAGLTYQDLLRLILEAATDRLLSSDKPARGQASITPLPAESASELTLPT